MKFVQVILNDKKYQIPEEFAEGVDKIINPAQSKKTDGNTMFEWQTDKRKDMDPEDKKLKDRVDELEKEMDAVSEEMKKKEDMEPNEFSNKTKNDPGKHGKKDKEHEKEDEDEDEEKKEDEGGNESEKLGTGLKPVPNSKMDSMIAQTVLDAQETISACKSVFTPGEFDSLKKTDSFSLKKQYVKKVNPNLFESIKESKDRNYVDGVFKTLLSTQNSGNRLDSALAEVAASYPKGNGKTDSVKKIDGTHLIFAQDSRQAFLNEKHHWMFDSPTEMQAAAKKIDQALEEDYSLGRAL